MLGGLAAGLGLAWLASSLGLGPAFGQFLLFALLALVVMVVIGMIMRARRAGAGSRHVALTPFRARAAADATPRQYSPTRSATTPRRAPGSASSMAFDDGKRGDWRRRRRRRIIGSA
jgi:predicted lipid-binding transport protein (Tim44 family)